MKVFLDDERTTPEGWVRTFWPSEVIMLLQAVADVSPSFYHPSINDRAQVVR